MSEASRLPEVPAGAEAVAVWMPSESAFRTSPPNDFGLVGSKCPECGATAFPRQEWCRNCLHGPGLDPYDVSMTGTIYSFTEVHAAPARFNPPYVVAFIDLDDGLRILAHARTPAEQLRTGQAVQLVSGEIGTTLDGKTMHSYVVEGRSRDA
jgi:uncharacterized protein